MVRLHSEDLKELTSPTMIRRSKEYLSSVAILELADLAARTQVQGTDLYTQSLYWDEHGVLHTATCSCPSFASGSFCKHLAASFTVLSSLSDGISAEEYNQSKVDDGEPRSSELMATAPSPAKESTTCECIESLTETELRDVLKILASKIPAVDDYLEQLGNSKFATSETVRAALESAYKHTFRSRGFIDWYKAGEVAGDYDEFIRLMRRYLSEGYAKDVEPFSKRAVKRITNALLRADDSSGMIGHTCQEALDFYAQVASLASPDPVKLAQWLVKIRVDSPGWPHVTLEPFVKALGNDGIHAYRREVSKELQKADAQSFSIVRDSEILQMQIELADYDGDLDAAIALLGAQKVPRYADIVRRLIRVNRSREAMLWVERAISTNRVSFSDYHRTSDVDVYGPDVMQMYIDDGFAEDAEALVWNAFCTEPSENVARALYKFCVTQGIWGKYESCVWDVVDTHNGVHNSIAVSIALAVGNLERAWDYAEKYGAGYAWEALADALAPEYPERALQLHFGAMDTVFNRTGHKGARDVVKRLREIWGYIGTIELAAQPQLMRSFSQRIAEIRKDYGNRPSLMKEMNEAGL